MKAGTRRAVGAVLLLSFFASLAWTVWSFVPHAALLRILYPARWHLAALAAIALVSNGYRLLKRSPAAVVPKPRPTHLKLVKTDETMH